MKIFNKENGKEVVYVQLDDIKMFLSLNFTLGIPSFILNFVCSKDFKGVNDFNRDNFIRFTDQEAVNYLKTVTWIIDYKDITSNKEEWINNQIDILTEEYNYKYDKYYSFPKEVQESSENLYTRMVLNEYSIYSLERYLKLKEHSVLPVILPLISKNDSFNIKLDSFVAKGCLNPYAFTIEKEDGSSFEDKDSRPTELIKKAIKIAAKRIYDEEHYNGGLTPSIKVSKDKKTIIITLFPLKKEKKKGSIKKIFQKN